MALPKQSKNPGKVNVEKFNFSNIETLKRTTFLQMSSFKKDLRRIFSYLLQFLRTVRAKVFYITYFVAVFEIGSKKEEKH